MAVAVVWGSRPRCATLEVQAKGVRDASWETPPALATWSAPAGYGCGAILAGPGHGSPDRGGGPGRRGGGGQRGGHGGPPAERRMAPRLRRGDEGARGRDQRQQ